MPLEESELRNYLELFFEVHSTLRVVQVNRGHDHFGFTLSGNAPVFIRSVDKGGAAERAGLQPGDQIWQLNGINIRYTTESVQPK